MRSQVADGGDGLQICRGAVKLLNKNSLRDEKGWSSRVLGEKLTVKMYYFTYGINSLGLGSCRVLIGISEGKTLLGTSRSRWEDNIGMYFQEIGWEAWTGLMWLGIGKSSGLLLKW